MKTGLIFLVLLSIIAIPRYNASSQDISWSISNVNPNSIHKVTYRNSFNEKCTNDEDCADMMVCSTRNRCRCKDDYEWTGNKCVHEDGASWMWTIFAIVISVILCIGVIFIAYMMSLCPKNMCGRRTNNTTARVINVVPYAVNSRDVGRNNAGGFNVSPSPQPWTVQLPPLVREDRPPSYEELPPPAPPSPPPLYKDLGKVV